MSALPDRLKTANWIEAKDGRLRPSTQFFEPPLMASRVGAGLPSGVLEAPVTGLAIDAHLITRASNALLLIVKGASMIEAGLMPGETLIAKKSSSAIDGDIFVALVNDAYSVMRRVREIRRCQAYGTRPRFTVLPIAMRRRCSSTGIERLPPLKKQAAYSDNLINIHRASTLLSGQISARANR